MRLCSQKTSQNIYSKLSAFTALTATALLKCFREQNYIHLFHLPEYKEMLCFSSRDSGQGTDFVKPQMFVSALATEHYFIIACVGTNQKMSLSLDPLIIFAISGAGPGFVPHKC